LIKEFLTEPVLISVRTGGENSFLLIQTGDVDLFVRDLNQAVAAAAELAKE
jgi:hypothetical protein